MISRDGKVDREQFGRSQNREIHELGPWTILDDIWNMDL